MMGHCGLILSTYALSSDFLLSLGYAELIGSKFGSARTIQKLFIMWDSLLVFDFSYADSI